MKKITDSEKDVLNLLWDTGSPLSSAEIVRMCVNRTWQPSYIHIMINSLLKKEMIKVAGFKQTTKNFARVFEPTMTREQWNLFQLKEGKSDSGNILEEILYSILKEEMDIETLDKLSDIIQKRKNELQEAL
ncbi:hypothetical protein B5E53_04490 [Eubacterium sp. An11]|uniref:BlaI/MecI/CopY family transcriptional regulator n=1 Tax=Eubacterium sp. An11 TaxID=1965542 RepID=UPI000B3670B0|nr:BlaI/MecI/CopY family transcriptional regulator [Eubacterium sp. An11]OUQ68790.1 hypothetical protein B5E53_04490 [Eubacterium sp. An11]